MRTGIIYKATNTLTQKVYIGQTIQTLSTRIRQHYKFAKLKYNYKFSNTLNKYNKESFIWEIIENNIPIEELNFKEIKYIELYDSFQNGYNSNPGGYSRFNRKATKEVSNNVKELFNTKTKELISINAYDFVRMYNSEYIHSAIYGLFNGKYLRFKDWILYENLNEYNEFKEYLIKQSFDRFTDFTIRRFINVKTNEMFEGLRTEFINNYQLSKGMVSQLINGKREIYRDWKIFNNN